MHSRWRDLVFVGLVLTLSAIYVSQPQRSVQWDAAWNWWKSFVASARSFQSAQPTAKRFTGQRVVIDQAGYDMTQITALATFGEIEYLGCDTVVTLDDEEISHRWLVTYWCGNRLRDKKLSVHFRLVNSALQSVTEETSGLILEDEWAWASVPFSETSLRGGQVWVELHNSRGDVLPVVSPFLVTEQGMDLLIWDRRQ
jgi:hypothetical protein